MPEVDFFVGEGVFPDDVGDLPDVGAVVELFLVVVGAGVELFLVVVGAGVCASVVVMDHETRLPTKRTRNDEIFMVVTAR